MDRKYQRVGMGMGAFHNPPRAEYSEETRNLIKQTSFVRFGLNTIEPNVRMKILLYFYFDHCDIGDEELVLRQMLMGESKLTMMQRKSIQKAVDRGESLPPPSNRSKSVVQGVEHQVAYPTIWRKRSQEMIIKSGAYEREQCRRTTPPPNKEKQKRHLACMMAYGKEIPETPHGPKVLHRARREPKLPENVDPVLDLVQGIRERMEFLNDMECLGMGKKYRPMIQQEVAEKVRILESLDKKKFDTLRKEIRIPSYERSPLKPYPLGEANLLFFLGEANQN